MLIIHTFHSIYSSPAEPDGEGTVRQRAWVARGAGVPQRWHPDSDRAEHRRPGRLVALLTAWAPGHRPREPSQAPHHAHVRGKCSIHTLTITKPGPPTAEAPNPPGHVPAHPGFSSTGHLPGATLPGCVPGPPEEHAGSWWNAVQGKRDLLGCD